MPAAVYVGDGEMTVRDLAIPTLGPSDALVEVSHCGICGTDLHLVLEKYARPDSVLGHEWAGTIAAVGDGVQGWEIGARGACRTPRRVAASAGRANGAGRRCVCGASRPTSSTSRTVRSAATRSCRRRACCAFPTRSRRARPRSPSRPRSRSTP